MTGQLSLLDDQSPDWRIDEETKTRGLRWIERIREQLAQKRAEKGVPMGN